MNGHKLVGALALFFAPIMLGVAIWLSYQTVHFLRESTTADGVIVDRKSGWSRRQGHTFAFKFRDEAGIEHRLESTAFMFNTFRVGATVNVLYLPSHPESARIDSFEAVWGPPLLTMGLAGLLVFIGNRRLQGLSLGALERRWR